MAKVAAGVGPRFPQVVVLFGATGDLSRRKLLPGLFHLATAGFIPGCKVIGVSLDDIDAAGFREAARAALVEFGARKYSDAEWDGFADSIDYVPLAAGPAALKAAVERAEKAIGHESRRLHYLSVPPNAALAAVKMLNVLLEDLGKGLVLEDTHQLGAGVCEPLHSAIEEAGRHARLADG